jgi:hypothetical protein
MPPLRLTDSQITHIFAQLGRWRCRTDPFLQEVASFLAGVTDIGDGDVARAIRQTQRRFFDPPQLTDARTAAFPCVGQGAVGREQASCRLRT